MSANSVHEWPRNVRELRNVLERAPILCEGALIDTDHLTLQSARSPRADTTDLSVVERTSRTSRTQLHLRIRKYRLEEAATA